MKIAFFSQITENDIRAQSYQGQGQRPRLIIKIIGQGRKIIGQGHKISVTVRNQVRGQIHQV